MNDKQLRENDILFLAETQILPNKNTYPIEAVFQSQFLCQFNSSGNMFCNIDLCSQVSINIESHQISKY